MNKSRIKKLQYLLVNQLLEKGVVELMLPDGITLEIGIVQDNGKGEMVKEEDYCYVVATRDYRSVMIDSYNLGLQYEDKDDTIICQDSVTDDNGVQIHRLDVV